MNLLVFRFSAMGDVALTRPVISHILTHNPDVRITLVTKAQFKPLFNDLPRFNFFASDFKGAHKGLQGLIKLRRQLLAGEKFDCIIDLHDVVRTWVLCFLFGLKGVPYKRIDKGRKAKQKLTRKNNKNVKQLKHTTQRYMDVFAQLKLNTGGTVELQIPGPQIASGSTESWRKFFESRGFLPKNRMWIGIAPYAKHPQKQWPIEKMRELIRQITGHGQYHVLLFGDGNREIAGLNTLAADSDAVHNLAGVFDLGEELSLIGKLDLMITMDSFNMHLAGLTGTTVISIWGATHPYAGFGPIGENEKFVVQISPETLPCRPCSVFGNRPCWRGDFACMQLIEPSMVMQKVKEVLG